MKVLVPSLAATVILAGASIAPAQTTTPISELSQGSEQTISGEVTGVFGNRFVLNDGTDQILVDTGPEWYRQTNINPGQRVTVRGEAGRNDFDAFSITTADGQTVEIRSGEGPPPWAGRANQRRQAERASDQDWRGQRTGSLREGEDWGDNRRRGARAGGGEDDRQDSRSAERGRDNGRRAVPPEERQQVESTLERLGLQLSGRLRLDDNRIKGEARSARGTNYEFELDRDSYEIVELDRD